ncbi:AraC family transcriptional regulator [Paraflavitalea soli]|uniref:AraC family transcriptional regulator n=1 Tax=Paraflavitalea soli TaxID=2315862 RepID=A0A3B7MV06_9BACT|nr:AraC family transcriptional regulator [Paraflavitalea soli]AXY77747.1 AraC family transcriptional regulator [Paraflavitalea soli]
MPLQFNSIQQQTTFYRNPISDIDLNSKELVESKEMISLEKARITFQNWCFDGFRLAYNELAQQQETSYAIRNDIDAVKIYFNRQGHSHIRYEQLSKSFSIRGGQYNMLYTDELDSRLSHIDNQSVMFSLQITRECFLNLVGEGGITLDPFTNKVAGKQPALFASEWLPINAAIERCIDDIMLCPFAGEMKKLYLRSKAVELFILFVQASSRRSSTKTPVVKSTADREKLYFARDYLTSHYADPVSLAALSKVTGLNAFKLKNGFRELFDTSVMDFLINYRLEQARELLMNTSKNISEIAYETGYSSPSYFSKAFKKKYGVSPKN